MSDSLIWKPSRLIPNTLSADTGGFGRYRIVYSDAAVSLRLDGRHVGTFGAIDDAKARAQAGADAAREMAAEEDRWARGGEELK